MAATTTHLPVPAARPEPFIGGKMPDARRGLILNLLVPLFLLIVDAYQHHLGADPVNFALHTTGLVAVTYIVASLAITPLRMITGWAWLVQFRRSVGVFAFYYAFAHLAIYFWWDRGRNVGSTVYEITHRYYLLIGFLSLALMAPLWATSTDAAIRALGGTRWKKLHRLAYIAAGLACWHLYLQSKADKRRPDVYFAILGALLLWRVGAFALHRWRAAAKTVPAPAGAMVQESAPAPVPVAPMPVPSHPTVTFQRSGRSAPLPEGETVLEAAESVGVEIEYQCRAGVCGTCRCKLISGRVTMEVRDALSDAEEAEGYILACQARATEDVVIDG
jgi:sulfoxide reductase heme-binding subunit YedZ